MRIKPCDPNIHIKYDNTNYLIFRAIFLPTESKFINMNVYLCANFVYTHFKSKDNFIEFYENYLHHSNKISCGCSTYNNSIEHFIEFPWIDFICEMTTDKWFELTKYIEIEKFSDKVTKDILQADDFKKLCSKNFFDDLYSLYSRDSLYRMDDNENITVIRAKNTLS